MHAQVDPSYISVPTAEPRALGETFDGIPEKKRVTRRDSFGIRLLSGIGTSLLTATRVVGHCSFFLSRVS